MVLESGDFDSDDLHLHQFFFQAAAFFMQSFNLLLLATFNTGDQPSLQPSVHDRSLMQRPGLKTANVANP